MSRNLRKIFLIVLFSAISFLVTAGGCSSPSQSGEQIPVYTYKIIKTYLHDREAYTQGLVYSDSVLYEGTGLNGRSTIRKVDLQTGAILQEHVLPQQYFGEGISVYNNRLVQLTWRSYQGFVYDLTSFMVLEEFSYATEGWGLTYDGSRLIMSDGSATLHFLDADTYGETATIEVHDNDGPVTGLNELEYIRGEIFANIYPTNRIARISPASGKVTGWINMSGLLSAADQTQPVDVLNGIAYDAANDRIFVTGKLWPKLFEVKFIPVKN